MKFIHYGNCKFDINKFKPIRNRPKFTKPDGGFWASRVDSDTNWKNYCEANEFYDWIDSESFVFSLKEDAKVLTINNSKQLESLPQLNKNQYRRVFIELDFEQLAKEYDAIEVLISEDNKLYFELYGWDSDSILIMNPDIIISENDSENNSENNSENEKDSNWKKDFQELRKKHMISLEEYERLLQVAEDKGKKDIKYIMRVLAETGIRYSDLEKVTVEAVKEGIIECDAVTKYQAKIDRQLKDELLKYCDEKGIEHGKIFLNKNGEALKKVYVSMEVKRIAKESNIKITVYLFEFRGVYIDFFSKKDTYI